MLFFLLCIFYKHLFETRNCEYKFACRYFTKQFSCANICTEGLQCNGKDLESLWKTSAQKFHLIISSSLKKIIYHTLMSLHTEAILLSNQKCRTLEWNHKTAVQIKFLGNWQPLYLYSFFNICTEISDVPDYLEGSDQCKFLFNVVVAKMNQF